MKWYNHNAIYTPKNEVLFLSIYFATIFSYRQHNEAESLKSFVYKSRGSEKKTSSEAIAEHVTPAFPRNSRADEIKAKRSTIRGAKRATVISPVARNQFF